MSTKDKIKRFLAGTKEATAKQIAAGIKMQDTPSELVNALNEMRTLGEVECEKKKGKGNEYWYWLTSAAPAAAEPERQPAAQEAQDADDKACCGAAKVMATTAGAEVAELRDQLQAAREANDAWLALAGEHECKSLADMRVYVDALLRRIETLKPAKPAGDHQPRRPFSVTGLSGYHAAPGKVTLFLDRRLSARSITLEASKLHQLADMARGSE